MAWGCNDIYGLLGGVMAFSLQSLIFLIQSSLAIRQQYLNVAVPRSNLTSNISIYKKYLANYQGSDSEILELCQKAAFHILMNDPLSWQGALETIATTYANDSLAYFIAPNTASRKPHSLPIQAAKEIMKNKEKYPLFLISLAAGRCREDLSSKIIPVLEIARREGWFTQMT